MNAAPTDPPGPHDGAPADGEPVSDPTPADGEPVSDPAPADGGPVSDPAPADGEPVSDPTPVRSRRRSPAVQFALLLVAFAFGLLLVVAFRPETGPDSLANARQSEVLAVLDGLTTQRDQLETELAEVARAREQLTAGSSQEALAQAEATLADYSILAGTAAAIGPGIVMVITDPSSAVSSVTFLDGVQELRDAGAEAIQIQSERIVAGTWFADNPEGLLISGVAVASPYTIRVIGDPETLATAMLIPGGFIRSVESAGATVTVERLPEVIIDATVPEVLPEYAQERRT